MKDPTKDEPVVLGEAMAAAEAAERKRRADKPAGPSPMPKETYSAERGDFDLVVVTPLPLDESLRAVTLSYRGANGNKRRKIRSRISMDELYTLIHFAKRSAVLALNERSMDRCREGLTALAMLDQNRVDPRDAAWAAALLAHAVSSVGATPDVVDEAAALATRRMAELLGSFERAGSGLSDWGYTELRTNAGLGLIRSGYAEYAPTFDLTSLALKLADQMRRGRYVPEVEIAVDVPEVWFSNEARDDAEQLLRRARGAASIRGALRGEGLAAQMHIRWIVEMPDERAAATLVRHVGDGKGLSGRFAVGVASGRLFGLLVAGSTFEGVEPVESLESLTHEAEETRRFMDQVTAQN